MTMPTQEAQRSRETAMQTERHWWRSKLRRLAADWIKLSFSRHTNDYDKGYRDACAACAVALDALIAERTK